MTTCKINNSYYIVDFNNFKFYSISTTKTFCFSGMVKLAELKDYLKKYDV